jgi:hypothetical protein
MYESMSFPSALPALWLSRRSVMMALIVASRSLMFRLKSVYDFVGNTLQCGIGMKNVYVWARVMEEAARGDALNLAPHHQHCVCAGMHALTRWFQIVRKYPSYLLV